MFQSIRPNSPLYILHKGDNPRLEIGYVSNQPVAKPKYPMPTTFGQPQEMVVDIVAKIGEQTVNYNGLPANLDIADSFSNGESITIADSKEAINSEIVSLKQKSADIIKSVKYHENMLSVCDKILGDLNPQFAEQQQQKAEIAEMKGQISDISKSLAELLGHLKNGEKV